METAKANNIAPSAYLRFLFANLPAATTAVEINALLPAHIGNAHLAHA
ncbi:MAG: transposase domain-containing protein [Desulfovibrio sp.]|nr:transposase domain-containing protein [Desulfovibrio sp.]